MKKNSLLVNFTLGALLFTGSLAVSFFVIQLVSGLFEDAALTVKTSLPGIKSQLTGRH